MNTQSLIGFRFGRLVVISQSEHVGHCSCLCDCGGKLTAIAGNLKSGATQSCGCIRRERNNHTTHAGTGTITFKRWLSMRKRCLDPKASNYPQYGGRGITVCARWVDSFENFLADMGECPDGMTIEREKNSVGYEPANCRWATRKEQNRNTSANHLLTYEGKTLCVGEWAELFDMNSRTIMSRLNKGWSVEETLGTPVRPSKTYKPRAKK